MQELADEIATQFGHMRLRADDSGRPPSKANETPVCPRTSSNRILSRCEFRAHTRPIAALAQPREILSTGYVYLLCRSSLSLAFAYSYTMFMPPFVLLIALHRSNVISLDRRGCRKKEIHPTRKRKPFDRDATCRFETTPLTNASRVTSHESTQDVTLPGQTWIAPVFSMTST